MHIFGCAEKKFVFGVFILALLISAINGQMQTKSQKTKIETSDEISKKDLILTKFIAQLVNDRFSNCYLLVLKDKLKDEERASGILKHTLFGAKYLVNFLNTSQTSTRVVPFTLPVKFTINLSNNRRYNEQCIVTISLLTHYTTHFWNQVRDIISPTFLPITRKDMDHFIFVADTYLHAKLLHLKGFINKIKFKIAIGLDNGNHLQVTTIDFFGGPNGSPKLVHLSVGKVAQSSEKVDFFPDFVWNLRGYTMQIVIPYAKSLVEANPAPWNYNQNAKRGHWKYLLEEFLMIRMNFTYRMFPSTGKDGKIGAGGTGLQLRNGTWIGLTGDLYYGRADIGLGAANTDKRIQYIGFTDTYFDVSCLIFVTGQPYQVYSPLALAWPFDWVVWMSTICSTIGALIVLHFAIKFLQNLRLEQHSITLGTQLKLILGPLVEQDSSILLYSNSLRIFIALWSSFSLVISNSYRSKLVALLAFPIVGQVPETFSQLAFSDFSVGFMKNGDSAYNTFTKSKDVVYVELIKKMEVLKGVNVDCLENVVSEEKYGCIAYDFDLLYLIQKNFSDAKARKIKFSGARTYNVWLGISTEPHSIYRVNFGKILGATMPFHLRHVWSDMDMYENVRKPKLKWWKETNQTEEFSQVEQNLSGVNLKLKNIKGVFHVYTFCVASSLLLLLIENVLVTEESLKFIFEL